MPAAAVIPAPIAYIKVVAVKKLVVGFLAWCGGPLLLRACVPVVRLPSFQRRARTIHLADVAIWIYYFEKIRVFKAGLRYEYISME